MVAANTTVQREAMVTCNCGVRAEGGRDEAIDGKAETRGSKGKEKRDGGGETRKRRARRCKRRRRGRGTPRDDEGERGDLMQTQPTREAGDQPRWRERKSGGAVTAEDSAGAGRRCIRGTTDGPEPEGQGRGTSGGVGQGIRL